MIESEVNLDGIKDIVRNLELQPLREVTHMLLENLDIALIDQRDAKILNEYLLCEIDEHEGKIGEQKFNLDSLTTLHQKLKQKMALCKNECAALREENKRLGKKMLLSILMS